MNIGTSDHSIATERGTLFARQWTPSEPGAAAPILLFHDSLGCVDLWRDFPFQLATATGRCVIAYDRLGFGRSAARCGALPATFMRDEASEAARVCDALRIDRVVVFGHSVGGGMAVTTAAHFPDRCAAVVTESAQSFLEERTLEGVRAAERDWARPGQLERLERYHGDKSRWVLDAWIRTWLSPAFAGWRLDDDLGRVRSPLLAIHGDNDEYGSPRHAERIAALVQGPSQVVILAACGHVPHREHPARVLGEVSQFLR